VGRERGDAACGGDEVCDGDLEEMYDDDLETSCLKAVLSPILGGDVFQVSSVVGKIRDLEVIHLERAKLDDIAHAPRTRSFGERKYIVKKDFRTFADSIRGVIVVVVEGGNLFP
jgi:hypothetical protein